MLSIRKTVYVEDTYYRDTVLQRLCVQSVKLQQMHVIYLK